MAVLFAISAHGRYQQVLLLSAILGITLSQTVPPSGWLQSADGDRIKYEMQIGSTTSGFEFSDLENVTLWKGLDVIDDNGKTFCSLTLNDNNHGPALCDIDYNSVLNFQSKYKIEIRKESSSGEHIKVFTIPADYFGPILNQRFKLTWVDDNAPNDDLYGSLVSKCFKDASVCMKDTLPHLKDIMHSPLKSFGPLHLRSSNLTVGQGVTCGMDDVSTVVPLLQAVMALMDASKQCTEKPLKNLAHTVHCEIDVTAAATAFGNMANAIVSAVIDCSGKPTVPDQACGQKAGIFATAVAGLASAAGTVVQVCNNPILPNPYADQMRGHGNFVKPSEYNKSFPVVHIKKMLVTCIIDVASALGDVVMFGAGVTSMDALRRKQRLIVDFGSSLASSVAHCATYAKQNAVDVGMMNDAACASKSLDLISQLDLLATSGWSMAKMCNNSIQSDADVASESRLYISAKSEMRGPSAFAIALPVGLLAAVVLGLALGKNYTRDMRSWSRASASEECCQEADEVLQSDLELTDSY